MRTLLLLAALAVPASGCAASFEGRPVELEGVSRAIAATLDDWHDAASKADESRYFGHLDADSVFLGTDASERWDKQAFLAYAHPHFAKGKAWKFHAVRRAVVVDGDGTLAHFDEDLATEKLGPARGSGVLALRGRRWVILQYNLTLTIPNERFSETREAVSSRVLGGAEGALAPLSWLSGAWISTEGARRSELVWSEPSRTSLLGFERRDGTAVSESMLRIEARDGQFVLTVETPGGQREEYRANGAPSADRVTFEGPGTAHVVFARSGEGLVVERGSPALAERYERAVFRGR